MGWGNNEEGEKDVKKHKKLLPFKGKQGGNGKKITKKNVNKPRLKLVSSHAHALPLCLSYLRVLSSSAHSGRGGAQ